MARRRYQRGTLLKRGEKPEKWVARWREDLRQPSGDVKRVLRSRVLGSLKDLPTKKLAQRALDRLLEDVNSLDYAPLTAMTFEGLARRWQRDVLPQHSPSTQSAIRSQLKVRLLPVLGGVPLRDIRTAALQNWLTQAEGTPKTIRNLFATLRMMWTAARAWDMVRHDPFTGLVMPKKTPGKQRSFSLEEIQRIIGAAEEPYRTFYWLAAETGFRAGELCGLRTGDLHEGLLRVNQSIWHGRSKEPKTPAGRRACRISTPLQEALLKMAPAEETGFIFHTKNGTPWDSNLLVKRKLHPLLEHLGIPRAGLHAFRHANASLMDRMGAPLRLRQDRLGHTDIRLTISTYTHANAEDEERMAAKMGAILNPKLFPPALPAELKKIA